jgi:hypothetical protein
MDWEGVYTQDPSARHDRDEEMTDEETRAEQLRRARDELTIEDSVEGVSRSRNVCTPADIFAEMG